MSALHVCFMKRAVDLVRSASCTEGHLENGVGYFPSALYEVKKGLIDQTWSRVTDFAVVLC